MSRLTIGDRLLVLHFQHQNQPFHFDPPTGTLHKTACMKEVVLDTKVPVAITPLLQRLKDLTPKQLQAIQKELILTFDPFGIATLDFKDPYVQGGETEASKILTAAAKGLHGDLETFAKRGANLNIADKNGNTPACFAAKYGHVDCLKVLAQHGAGLNLPEKEGITPACFAAIYGHADCLEVLVQHGADLNLAKVALWRLKAMLTA